MRIKLPVLWQAILLLTFTGSAAATNANPRVINEAFALRNVRILHGAQMVYSANQENDEFTSDLQVLRQAGLIDPVLSTGYKQFYNFTLTAQASTTASRSNFTVSAVPSRYGSRGRLSFFVDLLGRIHGADKNGEPATASDPIVADCSTGTVADNDRCTVYSLLRLRTAERRYHSVNLQYGLLSELYARGYIDARLGAGQDRGFLYMVTVVAPGAGYPGDFRLVATPISVRSDRAYLLLSR